MSHEPSEYDKPITQLSRGEWVLVSMHRIGGTLICFLASGILLWKSVTESTPKQSELKHVAGVINKVDTANTSRSGAVTVLIYLDGRNDIFVYPGWYPAPDKVYDSLEPDDAVRIAYNPRDHRVWGLEKQGQKIVEYESILRVESAKQWHKPVFGIILAVIGVFGARSVFKRIVNARKQQHAE